MQSGFMIPHVAAVALLNEAKVLAHPASVDNLPTSAGKEDHVSMGMTSALKLRTIVENAEHVFAIELLAAAEGLEFRRGRSKPGSVSSALLGNCARSPRAWMKIVFFHRILSRWRKQSAPENSL
jgi:histidine ammonia-lyase